MPAKKTQTSNRYPKKELNAWLSKHPNWDHNDWTALLDDLRQNGFAKHTDNQEGVDSIGLYLETHRKAQ